MAAPRTIVIPAITNHRATVICLHGLGDSGAGWSFLAENWRRRGQFKDVAFVFPSAPSIPITVNMGMSMPGWYDIANFDSLGSRTEDEAGILRSRTQIHSIVQNQIQNGIPASKIILGGFSQGGAMSLFSGLTFTEKLAGVFGLSCYQLIDRRFDELRAGSGDHKPPVFMGHGTEDPLVKFDWGKRTYEGLKQKGFDVVFNAYPGLDHGADPREIDELEKWVEARLADD